MIGVQSYADKANAAVERNRASLEGSLRRMADHDAAKPEGDDADGIFDWRRERRDLEDRVEADREALAFSESKAAEAAAAEADRKADAEHAAEEKAANADMKLVRQIDDLSRRLAAKRDELAASVARTAGHNARRGARAFIPDAEERCRRIPSKTVPASYRDDVVWENQNGERPCFFVKEQSGELVPRDVGFTRKVVTICQSPESFEPSRMPQRYADALVLVDIEGRKL
ncbi:MAG TPA: hypothetical protein VM620_09740 [Hyphomicrobium sp.]|nr:hypothetical protein [Hyphomicrobium sp.]